MEKKMNNKGFSLVELIVVIAIMAVLVGVLAPQFIKYVEKSRQSTDIQNCDTIKSVIEAYYSDKDNPPANVKVTIKTTGISTDDGNKGLSDAGVANNKLKSTKWGDITMTYNTTSGQWTYAFTATDKSKLYYKVNGTGDGFEVE